MEISSTAIVPTIGLYLLSYGAESAGRDLVPDHQSIGLLALSAIADDPRVRRQGDAFAAAGWDVVGIGLAGAKSSSPSWLVDDLVEAPDWSRSHRSIDGIETFSPLRRLWERGRTDLRYVMKLQAPRFSASAAEATYWDQNPRYRELHARAALHRPRVWLANDWNSLPIALRLAKEQGSALVYDTHELSAEEYEERLLWRFLHRPLVVAIERQGIKHADLVTCVSDGIADRLQTLYGLRDRPLVIRNTPQFEEFSLRPAGQVIDVLYHGIVSPGRGLEEIIDSLPLWRTEFRLTIRGPAAESYRGELERRVATAGVSERVLFAPSVPMTDLVREAHSADIGIFVLPDHSRHNRSALPNKFFEYVMAGLALCISDLPEMARLMRQYDLGRLIGGLSPEAIATQINTLDRKAIDCYKRNALAAARQLNWGVESGKLIDRCAALVTRFP